MTKKEIAYLIQGSAGIAFVGLLANIAAIYPHYALRAGIIIGLVLSLFIHIAIQSFANLQRAIVAEIADTIEGLYDSQNR